MPFSMLKFNIAQILKNKNFIADVDKKKTKTKKSEINTLWIKLKYDNEVGGIIGTKMISKPSRRMYLGKSDLKPVKNGYGVAIISTSKGVMSGEDAKKAGLGGEIICEVW